MNAEAALAVAVTLTVISTLLFLAKTWVGEAIRHKFRRAAAEQAHELTTEENALLEEIRRLNTQLQAMQNTANATVIEGQRVAAEWRTKTADAIWREIVRLRQAAPAVLTYLDILTPDEYQHFVTRADLRELALALEDERLWYWTLEAEHVRPFLGEDLFLKFFIYRACLGRVAYLLERDVRQGEVKPWFRDSGIRQHLRLVLEEDEMKQLDELPIGQLSWTLNIMEGKILDQLRRVVSGEISMTESLEQARAIRESIQKLEAEDRRYRSGTTADVP
ncbi:MAG: hypothetical protein OXG19_09695 [Chloroflexi bacterium]|nr:hypothetical protein [Chloroflexota bacterium]